METSKINTQKEKICLQYACIYVQQSFRTHTNAYANMDAEQWGNRGTHTYTLKEKITSTTNALTSASCLLFLFLFLLW